MGAKERRWYNKVKGIPEFKKKQKERNKTHYAKNKKADNDKSKAYYNSHKEELKLKKRELKVKLLKLIGDKCIICHKPKGIIFLTFHEIHGKTHSNNNLNYYFKHYKDFIPLCLVHHRAIHEIAKLNENNFKLVMELIHQLK